MSIEEARILSAWVDNARPWISAVQQGCIESRKQVTDRAIVEAVLSRAPRSALDIGCGEGWLARALAPHGVHVIGVDAVASLIEEAQRLGGGDFRVASYEDIAAGRLTARADLAVCNFSLLGKESVETLFECVPAHLNAGGSLLVQTLHPCTAGAPHLAYRDGWREGSWAGCGPGFAEPAPWYFRTLESWMRLFAAHGLIVEELHEPHDPHNALPSSIIFRASVGS